MRRKRRRGDKVCRRCYDRVGSVVARIGWSGKAEDELEARGRLLCNCES